MRIAFFTLIVVAAFFMGCKSDTVAPPQRMPGYSVHGVDVSHYQNRVNWDSVAATGVQFAFVKATEGETWQDSFFCKNWEKMRKIGLKRGAYHFLNPSLNARLQAENFLQMVDLAPGDLPPVVDIEHKEGVSEAVLIAKLRVWLWTVEQKTGVRPIIYTNLNFYQKWLAGHFDRYPLWIARFSTEKPVVAAGNDWVFWQYANHGRLSGVTGPVDFNVFRGKMADLEQLCIPTPKVEKAEIPVVAAAALTPVEATKPAAPVAQPAP